MSIARADSEPHIVAGPHLSARQLHDILQLRVNVFVVEQDCPYQEIDGHDLESATEHLWFADDDGIAAYVRLLEVGSSRVRVGRVVTRRDRRGDSLARRLIECSIARLPGVETHLDAQSHLVDWYRRLGYEPDGDEFIEDGIPHTPMRRPVHSPDHMPNR